MTTTSRVVGQRQNRSQAPGVRALLCWAEPQPWEQQADQRPDPTGFQWPGAVRPGASDDRTNRTYGTNGTCMGGWPPIGPICPIGPIRPIRPTAACAIPPALLRRRRSWCPAGQSLPLRYQFRTTSLPAGPMFTHMHCGKARLDRRAREAPAIRPVFLASDKRFEGEIE
jgi:hypothetical protein